MAGPPAADMLSQLGRYELLELLGRGGMAEVYKARLPGALGFDKLVAVKRILPEARANKEYVDMFVREARLCSRMMHPNLIQVFEFAETQGELFLAMELVEGSDLRKVITAHKQLGKGIPLEFVSCVALGVLRGLDGAHRLLDEKGKALNVVHRDLSPANVLLSYEGAIKVADFGVAHTEKTDESDGNSIKGKLQYMAPEQLLTGHVDIRVDVFAAGCVLYEMLSGTPVYPFGQTPEVIQKVAKGIYEPIERLVPGIDPDVAAVVRKALAANPDQRYSDCSAFAADLGRLIQAGKLPAASNEEFGLYLQVLLPKQPFRAELTYTPAFEDLAVPILTGQLSEEPALVAPIPTPPPMRNVADDFPLIAPNTGPLTQAALQGALDPKTGPSTARPISSLGSDLDPKVYVRPPSNPQPEAAAPPRPAPPPRPATPAPSISELDKMLQAYLEEGGSQPGKDEQPKVEVKQEKKWFKWLK